MGFRAGRGQAITKVVNYVLETTGVSLRPYRKELRMLRTLDLTVLVSTAHRKDVARRTLTNHRERYGDERVVLITGESGPYEIVEMSVDTFAWLLAEAVNGNKAHWARPVRSRKNTDEGIVG